MKKAAVVADNYKLPVFRRILKEAGYTWKESPFVDDTTTMVVEVEDDEVRALTAVVKRCNQEATRKGPP